MAAIDPTNARLRDFDIPVVMPRFDLIELPPFDDAVSTCDFTSDSDKPRGPRQDN